MPGTPAMYQHPMPGGFIATGLRLDPKQAGLLAELVQRPQPALKDNRPLGGRTGIRIAEIPGIGAVVLKPYARGGLVRFLLKDRYVRIGACRAAIEYRMLGQARAWGVNVPEPVAYARRGKMVYQCWLITAEIKHHGTLARLSQTRPHTLAQWMPRVSGQIRRLISKGIHHVDLHPGNVLAGLDHKAYLIDFDKARISKMGPKRLAAKYMARWKRAVDKYGLDGERLRLLL